MHWLNVLRQKSDSIKIALLCLIAATIPFSIKFGNIAIILAVSFNILFFKKENFKSLKSFRAWYLIVYFFITVISGVLSKNIDEGIKHLDLTLLLVLFAVIMINSSITKEVVHKVMRTLYFSSVLSTLILLFNTTYKAMNKMSFQGLTFHEFTSLYDQHPVYYAMYLSLALFYVSFISSKEIKQVLKTKIIFLSSVCVLVVGIVFCASKAVLALAVIAFLGFYIYKTRSSKKRIIVLVLFPLLSVLVYNIHFIKERFDSGLRFNENIASFQPTNDFTNKKLFNYDEKTDISDLELRYILGKIYLYHAAKDNKLFFGYGQGDTEQHFNYYYFSYNLGPNWYENTNVHNQYIHILVMYGVFVLLFFLYYLGYSFKVAISKKDALHLYFLLLTCFVFIFEVVLVRNKGIIFFYFFNSLFLFNTFNLENSNTRD